MESVLTLVGIYTWVILVILILEKLYNNKEIKMKRSYLILSLFLFFLSCKFFETEAPKEESKPVNTKPTLTQPVTVSLKAVVIFSAGNSVGFYEMLQWTSTATGYPRFGMLVHHTDEVREWAYDRTSHIGRTGQTV